MRIDWRLELPQWLLIGGMFALAAINWQTAPDRIPVHWDLAGEVDRYGGKFEGLLLLPLMALGLYLLLLFLPLVDPLRANYARFRGTYAVLRLGVMVVIGAIYAVTILWIGGRQVDVGLAVTLVVGGLMLLLGILLPRVQPTWFVGIRTPWTLSSRESWEKTHRVGSYYFIALGIAIIIVGVSRAGWALWLAVALMLGGLVGLIVYSYLVWRADPNKSSPLGR